MRVLTTWRRRRQCMHGEPIGSTYIQGQSHVSGQLIDLGRRKMWTCGDCGKRWFS